MKRVGNEDLCFVCGACFVNGRGGEEEEKRTKKGENVCALMFGRPWKEIQSLVVGNLNGEEV